MSRVRNAVIIIILCIIGAYSFKKGPQLGLNMPAPEDIKDAVAGNPVRRHGPQLTLASGNGEDLRDAVAGHAVGTPNRGTNTLGDVDGPPRGSGNGGFGPLSNNNNNNNPPVNPPPSLSPSGPTPPPEQIPD
ncbi:MAG: hypothetical protein PHS14_07480 [Elusimicrobia bacterium]|nr:hypothetical protein [Elusimicrobiota bacterium]